MAKWVLACILVGSFNSTFLLAQANETEPVFSGPQAGEPISNLEVVLAYGPNLGTRFDPVKAANGRPLMLVFVQGTNRPAARLTRVLMNFAEMHVDDGLTAAVIWLANDRSAAQRYLGQAVSWWGVGMPVGVSVDGMEGPGSYGLNRNVNVTVLIARDHLVTANFALVQPSEMDATRILGEVTKLIGGEAPTLSEVLFLSAPTRKLGDAKWQVAPKQVEFRRIICKLLAAENEEQATQAAKTIETFMGDDAERQRQLREIAGMLLKGRTRIPSEPAAAHLRRWRGNERD